MTDEEAERIFDEHFAYQVTIEERYRERDRDPAALAEAIAACETQIALAPKAAEAFLKAYPNSPLPSHRGFQQLAVIREKEGDYTEAIRLSEAALEQGWAGDWEKRIARCERRHLATAKGFDGGDSPRH